MKTLYIISIFFYKFITKLFVPFNIKAKQRIKGLKNQKKLFLKKENSKHIWVHCASLGEFEQGRSVLEKLKLLIPEAKIILSFFSPSGYEIRKNYENADIICYLPFDTRKNASDFINRFNPDIAIFIKYEFWHFFINELKTRGIPTLLVSGIFRENQIFFKPYGKFFKNILLNFTHLFLQDENSKSLLSTINIKSSEVTGDTRFDRVFEISENPNEIKFIPEFKKNKLIFIAGSVWIDDIEIISDFINNYDLSEIKIIIVPHETNIENIKKIESKINKKTIKYSDCNINSAKNEDILIVDKIGFLSSLYNYADIAYIGGGFGAGIHNTLEAAVFGIPLIFGSNYKKFKEAKDLISTNAAFTINSSEEFKETINYLINNPEERKSAGENSRKYVLTNTGATKKIIDKISKLIF